jgi:hypothetical protein
MRSKADIEKNNIRNEHARGGQALAPRHVCDGIEIVTGPLKYRFNSNVELYDVENILWQIDSMGWDYRCVWPSEHWRKLPR